MNTPTVAEYGVAGILTWQLPSGRAVTHADMVAGSVLTLAGRISTQLAAAAAARRTYCPHDGCALTERDDTCPACRARLV